MQHTIHDIKVWERFWDKVDKSGECHLWTGKKNPGGGKFYFEGKFTAAHRFLYESLHGTIPLGQWLHQRCGNKCCVNPEHFYLESDARGRSPEERFWEKVDKTGDCWLWTGKKRRRESCAYGVFWGGDKDIPAHRKSYEIATGKPIPEGMCVCHRCDVPLCVNPDHLFLGTQLDNVQDMFSKKRDNHAHGERVNTAKLDAEDVYKIRQTYKKGGTIAELARQYGVSWDNMNCIVKGKTWKHLLD